MVDEQNDEQNDRDRDAVDALLDGLHAPVTPQPKPQPTPEPTPEHDYYFCWLSDCQRCADYADGYSRPNPSTLPSWVSTSVSNRLMVLVLAAGLSGPPRRPTTTRIVGSSANRSASLVSS